MKIRHSTSSGQDKVEMQMTPMIDIVFQLLTFFLMSFKIATQEGDFNIKMPVAAPSAALPEEEANPITIRLKGEGDQVAIEMNGQGVASFSDLRKKIIGIVGADSGPNSLAEKTEVEFDCDYNLHYSNVIRAVTAVSGYPAGDGTPIKLIQKIKFSPPKKPAGS